MHVNGKAMNEDYLIPDMETIFHNPHGAAYWARVDLSNACYHIELYDEAKDICAITTSQVLYKICRLLQRLKDSSSIFLNVIGLEESRVL